MGPVSWDELRVALALHEAGTVRVAGRALGVDKATVSRRLAALEEQLGVRVFDRRADGFALTARGARVIDAARRMGVEAASLGADLSDESGAPRVTVRITAPVFFSCDIVIPALPRFVRENPGVEIAFVAATAVLNLARREAEVAVRNVRPSHHLSMSSRRAGELGSALYGTRAALGRRRPPRTEAEVLALPFVGYERVVSYVRAFDWLERVPERQVRARCNDTLALAAAVRAGVGVGVLPCVVGDRDPRLTRIEAAGKGVEVIWLVTPTELRRTRGVRAVMDFLVAVFRESAAALLGP